MKFSKLLFTVLMLFALNSFSALYDSDDEAQAFGRLMVEDTHKYRQAQLDQSRGAQRYQRRDDHAYKQACLDQSRASGRAAQKLKRDQLAFEKEKYAEEKRGRSHARHEEEKRAEDSERRERHEHEAQEYLKAWSRESKSNPGRLDGFTRRAIQEAKSAHKAHVSLSTRTVREILERKKTTLAARRIDERDLRKGKYSKDRRSERIIEGRLSDEIVGRSHHSATRLIANEAKRESEKEEREHARNQGRIAAMNDEGLRLFGF